MAGTHTTPGFWTSPTTVNRHVTEFYRVFCLLDADKDGFLGHHDITETLDKLSSSIGGRGKNFATKEEVDETLKSISTFSPQKRNKIDFPTFLNWVTRTAAAGNLENRLSGIFSILDTNKDGKMSSRDVCTMANKLGVSLELNDAQEVFGADLDFSSFCTLIGKALPEH